MENILSGTCVDIFSLQLTLETGNKHLVLCGVCINFAVMRKNSIESHEPVFRLTLR